MPTGTPRYELIRGADTARLVLRGDWTIEQDCPAFPALAAELDGQRPGRLACDTTELGDWDSALPAFLLHCHQAGITLDTDMLPEGARRLLRVATAVKTHQRPEQKAPSLAERLDPRARLAGMGKAIAGHLQFIGEVTLALAKLFAGRANTRRVDFVNFVYQAGPEAFRHHADPGGD